MAITMFISMWIQNFIVVAMMSSVCVNILEQLEAVSLLNLWFFFKQNLSKQLNGESKGQQL